MSRHVAFLGGINVGGHRVTMDRLRAEFEALGLAAVSTFIASGNVIFDTSASPASVEAILEHHLAGALGYAVPTFVRSSAAVRKAAALEPFDAIAAGDTHGVVFLRRAPTAASKRAVEALTNDHDRFEVHGKELHWLIHGGFSDSSVKPAVLARALGQASTTRNAKSLRKLAAKLA